MTRQTLPESMTSEGEVFIHITPLAGRVLLDAFTTSAQDVLKRHPKTGLWVGVEQVYRGMLDMRLKKTAYFINTDSMLRWIRRDAIRSATCLGFPACGGRRPRGPEPKRPPYARSTWNEKPTWYRDAWNMYLDHRELPHISLDLDAVSIWITAAVLACEPPE